MKKLFALATMALMATAAQAATFTSFAGPDIGPLGSQVIAFDFEAATPELTGSYSLVTGSVSGQYAAPLGNATQYAVVPKTGSVASASADLSLSAFTRPIRSLSLYWGSIDTYNTLDFYNGATLVFSILGPQLPPADGDQGDAGTNRRVSIDFGPGGQTLTSMRFTSTDKAFEFDDIAIASVPEPQSWGLMIVGFGLVGAAARRRTRMTAVTA